MIKAVLFDMDGVLIDAKEWHYDALNRALAHFGYAISRYDHLVTYDGLPTRKKLEMLTLERGLPKGLHGYINELKQLYTMQITYQECTPKFNHEYALSTLKSEGFKLAVASNSIRNTIEVMMDLAKLTPYLDTITSNQDVTTGKPNPEIYLKTMEKLGLQPTECLIVEDNEHGIKAAKASGGHLLVVKEPSEVTYQRIKDAIAEIERGGK